MIDAIPLFEIDYICAALSGEDTVQDDFNPSHKRSENDKKTDPQNGTFKNSFQIRTLIDGYNSGRAYYLKASSEKECADIVEKLTKSARAAKKAKEAKTRFEQSQERVRNLYRSNLCQGFTATMIVLVLSPAIHECWPSLRCCSSGMASILVPKAYLLHGPRCRKVSVTLSVRAAVRRGGAFT